MFYWVDSYKFRYEIGHELFWETVLIRKEGNVKAFNILMRDFTEVTKFEEKQQWSDINE